MKKILEKILIPGITAILLLSLLFAPFFNYQTREARAGVLDSLGTFTGCAASGIAGGIAGDLLSNMINDNLGRIEDLMSKIPYVGVVFAQTVPVNDARSQGLYKSKELVQDVIARCAAREVLTAMSNNILNVARTSGRDGGPAYVRDWRNFQIQAQFRGEDIFRAVLASANLCGYFEDDVKGIFSATKKVQSDKIPSRVSSLDQFKVRVNCTLPQDFNINDYLLDFAGNGGWDAWSRLMKPENNFYGVLANSLDEIKKRRSLEESADVNEALAGNSFTSRRGDSSENCLVKSVTGRCIVYNDILTPGFLIATGVEATINQELSYIVNVDELNELIASAVQVVLNRLLDFSNPNEGDYLIPGELNVSISPPPPSFVCQKIDPSEGAIARYQSEVSDAMTQYLNDPDNSSVVDAPNNDPQALEQYLFGVAAILSSQGFTAGRATNCNNQLGKDAIIVFRTGDIYGDYYDLVGGAGTGGSSIGQAGQPPPIFVEWANTERIIYPDGSPGGGGPPEQPPPSGIIY